MIGVVDYDAGNLTSVANALSVCSIGFVITADTETLSRCRGVILPGVGAAPGAMRSLDDRGLTEILRSLTTPFLGICLGMQLLHTDSEEGNTECLGVIPGTIRLLQSSRTKVPHMGWNTVRCTMDTPLMKGMRDEEYFYFAHSYIADINGATAAVSDCGMPFSAVMQQENYFGVQFHPEKSGDAGLKLLRNFDAICASSRR